MSLEFKKMKSNTKLFCHHVQIFIDQKTEENIDSLQCLTLTLQFLHLVAVLPVVGQGHLLGATWKVPHSEEPSILQRYYEARWRRELCFTLAVARHVGSSGMQSAISTPDLSVQFRLDFLLLCKLVYHGKMWH